MSHKYYCSIIFATEGKKKRYESYDDSGVGLL